MVFLWFSQAVALQSNHQPAMISGKGGAVRPGRSLEPYEVPRCIRNGNVEMDFRMGNDGNIEHLGIIYELYLNYIYIYTIYNI